MIVKPMLAASLKNSKDEEMTFSDLTYPLGASIKLDGIRCLRINGKTLSRSFKPIPNTYIQSQMNQLTIDNLDGELITYNANGSVRTFNEIQSDIMSEDGEPNFRFEIFDYVKDSLNKPYMKRISDLGVLHLPWFCSLIMPTIINNEIELLAYEEQAIADGHEGIMTRRLDGPYKCGRSTFKSQDLIKVKRFKDSEAIIIGFEEKLRNENEVTIDALGHTERSSAKAGLVPAGTLGNFLVRDMYTNIEFEIGTGIGLNDILKQKIWNDKAF